MMFSGMDKGVARAAALVSLVLLLACTTAEAATPEALLQQLNNYPHAQQVAVSEEEVRDHEVGLGAMQKVQGAWRFKNSERQSGLLSRHTWQIVDGFTSIEVMDKLVAILEEQAATTLLFACDARACGQGAQWANRVFHQRVLYGREDLQRYRVFALQADGVEYRLAIYSSARTADRQYLHVDLLRIAEAD